MKYATIDEAKQRLEDSGAIQYDGREFYIDTQEQWDAVIGYLACRDAKYSEKDDERVPAYNYPGLKFAGPDWYFFHVLYGEHEDEENYYSVSTLRKEADEFHEKADFYMNMVTSERKGVPPNKLVLVVDMQNDFVTGSLGTPEAQAIVTPQVQFVIKCNHIGMDIAFTRDTHGPANDYLETQEGKNLPVPHTEKGTFGWNIISNHRLGDHLVIDKASFGALNLIEPLADRNGNCKYDEIIVVGVCTGICVISNVLILKAAFPETKVTVVENLCACVTPESHQTAIEAMKTCQVDIQTWEGDIKCFI